MKTPWDWLVAVFFVALLYLIVKPNSVGPKAVGAVFGSMAAWVKKAVS